MLTTINRFVDTMLKEENKFASIQNEISGKETCISSILEQFKQRQRTLMLQMEQSTLAKGDTLVQEILKNTTSKLDAKLSAAEQHIQEGLKGTTFIKTFEKSFTVSVFGKVKAGKSYLGNYVMGEVLRNNHIPSSYDKLGAIPVTIYDKGKLSQNTKLTILDKLEVKMNEATSTIQYFSIGGITWFDTPGIGSITVENEELAKEYIKNSDLVVYASISDAAGTRQDFEEMKTLYDMGKPMLLLLTQSDTTEFDVDDDDNEIQIRTPKSQKDRKDAEDYMVESLEENGISKILDLAEIMSVSAKLANEAIKTDNKTFLEQSNMNTFLEKLIDITKNEAADMKRKTPMQRMNKTIQDIIKQLYEVEVEIGTYFSQLDNTSDDLKQREQLVLQTVKSDVNKKVKEKLRTLTQKVKTEGGSISGKQLQEIIDKLVNDSMTTICAKEMAHLVDQISAIELPQTSVGELKMQTGTIQHQRKESYQKRRDPEKFHEHIFGLFGKEYYRSSTRNVTETSTFELGVNEAEIHKNVMQQLNTVFEQQVSAVFSNIFKNYYTSIKTLEKDLTTELKTTIKTLEGLLQ